VNQGARDANEAARHREIVAKLDKLIEACVPDVKPGYIIEWEPPKKDGWITRWRIRWLP
jgi:hypothetical protein